MNFEQMKNRVADKVKNLYSNKRKVSYPINDNTRMQGTKINKQAIIDNFDAFIREENPKAVKFIRAQFDFAEIEKSILNMEREEDKVIAIKLLKDKMLEYSIINILDSFDNEANIIKLIEIIKEEWNEKLLGKVIDSLDKVDTKLKAIEVAKDKLSGNVIFRLTYNMDDAANKIIIEKYGEKLGSEEIMFLTKEMNNKDKLEILEKCLNKVDTEAATFLANSLSNSEKMHLLANSNDRSKILTSILSTYHEITKDVEKYGDELLKITGVDTANREFAFKLISNFGAKVITKDTSKLLSTRALEFFGEDNIYSIFKYYIFTGDKMVDISEVLEKPELFRKYKVIRQKDTEKKQMSVMDLVDSIEEFNNKEDLISEYIKEDKFQGKEKNKLRACLKDKVMNVDSINGVKAFTKNRYKKIKQLINSNPNEAMIYLFTGMSGDEYQEEVKDYVDGASNAMNDFSENIDFAIVKTISQTMKLISQMELSKKKSLLNLYNKELLREFSSKGSFVSKIHDAYDDIDVKIKKAYGKELSTSLKEANNFVLEEKDGVQIIDFKGQDFKMLIHGVDAYNLGSGRFEKREVGKSYICTTLISQKNMMRADAKCYYGFDEIGDNALIFEGTKDIFSRADTYNSLEVKAARNLDFNKAENLIDKTGEKTYNEVTLWREYLDQNDKMKDIEPNYVVCFNEITQADREEAKRLGIPIVLIEEKEYEKNLKNNFAGKVNNEKLPSHAQGDAKIEMLNILKNADQYCRPSYQKDAMEKIIKEIEREQTLEIER